VGLCGDNISFLGALCPFQSGLMNKHIVKHIGRIQFNKHIVKHSSVQFRPVTFLSRIRSVLQEHTQTEPPRLVAGGTAIDILRV
jgi:hypothetical protein